MVLCCGLKMAIRCVGSGAFCKGLWSMPSTATARVLSRATWYELQSEVKIVSIFTRLGGAWESRSCEPNLVASSAVLGAAQQVVPAMLRPDIACLWFVNL